MPAAGLLSTLLFLSGGLKGSASGLRLGRVDFQVRLDGGGNSARRGSWRSSEEIEVCGKRFCVVAYPDGFGKRAGTGIGALYLEYLSAGECACRFGLGLVSKSDSVLTFENQGGAVPGGGDMWVGAITFGRGAETEGYANRDWGAHAWPARAFVEGDCTVVGFVEAWEPELSVTGLRSGAVVVPVARNDVDTEMLEAAGLTTGSKYRVMTVDGGASYCASQNSKIAVRPAYNNQGGPWPTTVAACAALWYSSRDPRSWPARAMRAGRKRLATAVLTSLIAGLAPWPLLAAARQVVGLYAIPSESMAPSLRSGDLLLVAKFRTPPSVNQFQLGDIVLFEPPPNLARISNSRARDTAFVKRVAALPGQLAPTTSSKTDSAFCDRPPLRPLADLLSSSLERPHIVESNSLWVLGDCTSISIDSRVWGDLPVKFIIGSPKFVLWPPNHFGPIDRVDARL